MVNAEHVKQQAAADNIDDGVHGSDFMEMYLVYRCGVNSRFCFGNESVNGESVPLNVFRQIEAVN